MAQGRDVARRIKYYLTRLKALNGRNMIRMAQQISGESGKPTLFILVDMAWCSVRYEAGYFDYHEFEYHLLNHRQRKTYLTRPQANTLVIKLNKREFSTNFSDKSKFNRAFDKYLGRAWIDVREADAVALESFVRKHKKVMAKVTDSLAGYGVEKLESDRIEDYTALHAQLLEKRQFLVEEFLLQHPEMSRLAPPSVNTLRVVSYFDGEKVHLLAHVLKMGNGITDMDNFGQGGMYTVIDEHGHTHYAAFDKVGHKFSIHPVTGVDITNFQVPMFEKVIEVVDSAARVFPQVPYVGWDIAITPTGPAIIEGNYNTGVFQMKPSLTGVKTGLLPRYKQIIGF